MGCTMNVVPFEDLSDALEHGLNLAHGVAERDAEFLLDLFGYEDRIVDNVLEPEERQLFYNLQGVGVLSVRSEETNLYNGQAWRTHYWLLRDERIHALASAARERREAEATGVGHDLYLDLPENVWARP